MPFSCSSKATGVDKFTIGANDTMTGRSDQLHMTPSVFFAFDRCAQARSHGLWVVQTTFRAIFRRNQVMNRRKKFVPLSAPALLPSS